MSATEKGGVNFPVNSSDEAVSGWSEETACYAANWDDEEKWLLTAAKVIKANVLITRFSSKSIELISPL